MWTVLKIRNGTLEKQHYNFKTKEKAQQFIVELTTEPDVVYTEVEQRQFEAMSKDEVKTYCHKVYIVVSG